LGGDEKIDFVSQHSISVERCIYRQSVYEIQAEYMTKFWEAYPDTPKYYRLSSMISHEMLGENIYHFDQRFLDTFKMFYERGYLKNTQVIIMSDHGAHDFTIRTAVFPDDSRSLENALPIMINLSPSNFDSQKLAHSKNNEQSFITSHDVYATLKSLAFNYKEGSPFMTDYSFIHEDIPEGRDCDSIVCKEH
jgi:hypothetical protein